MMKRLLGIIFLFAAQFARAQNLEISGRVIFYDLPAKGKIYYTQPGKKFDPKIFVPYDQFNYKFKISLDKIKKENIQDIVFSADTVSRSADEYACVHRIHVGAIVNDPQFKNAGSIKLKSDLPLGYRCTSSVAYGATEEGKKEWVGSYLMQHADTTFNITLGDIFFTYEASLSLPTADLMNRQWGFWNYNAEKNTLSFVTQYLLHDRFGIMLNRQQTYSFKVSATPGVMEFKADGITLKKL